MGGLLLILSRTASAIPLARGRFNPYTALVAVLQRMQGIAQRARQTKQDRPLGSRPNLLRVHQDTVKLPADLPARRSSLASVFGRILSAGSGSTQHCGYQAPVSENRNMAARTIT